MGILKKIAKATGVSKLFSGVKKVFKSITKSSLGKVLLVAAAIYLGGAYLGAWGGPSWMPTAAGAAGAEAAGAVAGEVAGAGAGTSGAAELLAAGEAAGAAAGEAAATGAMASPATANLAAGVNTAESAAGAPWNQGSGLVNAAPPPAPAPAPWYKGPMGYGAMMAGGGLIQGMGAGQAAEEKIKAEREAEERRQALITANFDPAKMAALGIGVSPSGAPLTDINGNPVYPPPAARRGLIGASMAPRV